MGASARNPDPRHPVRPTLEPAPSPRAGSEREMAESAVHDFSIVMGGPIYDFLLSHGYLRFALPNLVRRIVFVVALTWLPLLLLSLKDGLAFGHRVVIPLLFDLSVYGRFLLALPLLMSAEVIVDPSIRVAVGEFVDAHLVPDEELPAFQAVLARTRKLRDSWIPEVTLLVLAFFPVFLFQREWTIGAVSSWHTLGRGLTAAGWWYALFSTPLLRFVLYRWLFRYFIWALLLWRIGRLRLSLLPTHPDHAAGLNFLGIAQKKFGILFCALGCAFAGRMANTMAFENASVSSFKMLMTGFLVLFVIVGLLPLMLLAPKLREVRRAGLLEYGRLANTYSASFDKKWVHNREAPSEQLLGSADIRSLADMGNSFALVDAMSIAPITKRLILQLVGLTILPLIPVIVLGTPTPELIHAIIRMVA
jgi:hypothetical protein